MMSSESGLPLAAASRAPVADLRIAVLIPCFNEERCIFGVVSAFKRALPEADIFVYDNNSTDGTIKEARSAGAIVRTEPWQGKGNVVRRMFSDIDADVYVLVDGDGTYDALSAPRMLDTLLEQGLDMLNAARVGSDGSAFRPGHEFGNFVLSGLVTSIFGHSITDVLSGYRVFSRRFVKSFPALSTGFEIETELTVHALELRMPMSEILTPYGGRANGSVSKLRTFRDGFRILRTIVGLVKEERPLPFFTASGTILAAISLALGWPLIHYYLVTGTVPRLPTAVLATGLMLVAFLSFACGLILDSVTHGRREMRRLHYLQMPVRATRRARARLGTPVLSQSDLGSDRPGPRHLTYD